MVDFDIIYSLPKEILLSPDLKERAIAYFKLSYYSGIYYFPITKEMKKQFEMRLVGGILLCNYKAQHRFGIMVRDIIDSVYLQVRDNVCEGIKESLSQDLKEGFAKLFEKTIHNKVKEKIQLRLEEK